MHESIVQMQGFPCTSRLARGTATWPSRRGTAETGVGASGGFSIEKRKSRKEKPLRDFSETENEKLRRQPYMRPVFWGHDGLVRMTPLGAYEPVGDDGGRMKRFRNLQRVVVVVVDEGG